MTLLHPNHPYDQVGDIAHMQDMKYPKTQQHNHVAEIIQNHKGYEVPCLANSCLENLMFAS